MNYQWAIIIFIYIYIPNICVCYYKWDILTIPLFFNWQEINIVYLRYIPLSDKPILLSYYLLIGINKSGLLRKNTPYIYIYLKKNASFFSMISLANRHSSEVAIQSLGITDLRLCSSTNSTGQVVTIFGLTARRREISEEDFMQICCWLPKNSCVLPSDKLT